MVNFNFHIIYPCEARRVTPCYPPPPRVTPVLPPPPSPCYPLVTPRVTPCFPMRPDECPVVIIKKMTWHIRRQRTSSVLLYVLMENNLEQIPTNGRFPFILCDRSGRIVYQNNTTRAEISTWNDKRPPVKLAGLTWKTPCLCDLWTRGNGITPRISQHGVPGRSKGWFRYGCCPWGCGWSPWGW